MTVVGNNNTLASNCVVIGNESNAMHDSCVVLGPLLRTTEDCQVLIGNSECNLDLRKDGRIFFNGKEIIHDSSLVEAMRNALSDVIKALIHEAQISHESVMLKREWPLWSKDEVCE